MNFTTRTSPAGLFRLILKLNDAQKRAVEEIGFGSLLSLNILNCPSDFGQFLVRSFDHHRRSFILSRGDEIQIDEEDVVATLNLPRGNEPVLESSGKNPNDSPEYITFLREWRRRMNIFVDYGAPKIKDLEVMVINNKRGDKNFKVDFMVYVVTSFVYSSQCQQSRFMILQSLMDVDSIKQRNWCRYLLNGLTESKKKWNKNESSFYHGPLTFLMLFYLDRVLYKNNHERWFPIISCWNQKKFIARINEEKNDEGYGRGRPIGRIEIPTLPSTSTTEIPNQSVTIQIENNQAFQAEKNQDIQVEVNPAEEDSEIPGGENLEIPGEENLEIPGETNLEIPGKNSCVLRRPSTRARKIPHKFLSPVPEKKKKKGLSHL